MTYLNPQCAKCMAELHITWCDRVCKNPERTLVDMDKGTHYDTTQEVGEAEHDRFDYLTGQNGT